MPGKSFTRVKRRRVDGPAGGRPLKRKVKRIYRTITWFMFSPNVICTCARRTHKTRTVQTTHRLGGGEHLTHTHTHIVYKWKSAGKDRVTPPAVSVRAKRFSEKIIITENYYSAWLCRPAHLQDRGGDYREETAAAAATTSAHCKQQTRHDDRHVPPRGWYDRGGPTADRSRVDGGDSRARGGAKTALRNYTAFLSPPRREREVILYYNIYKRPARA